MEKFYDLYERYRDYIMATIILLIIIGLSVFYYYYFNDKINTLKTEIVSQKSNKIEISSDNDKSKVYVDIKGEVNRPGVYNLSSDKRVVDVIKMAGGLTNKADTSVNNLGKKLTDEMVIIIYGKNEIKKMSTTIEKKAKIIEECNNSIPVNNDCLETKDISEGIKEKNNNSSNSNKTSSTNSSKTPSKTSKTLKGKVSLNTATKEELMSLSGIGESKANSIIEYRSKTKFNDISEIKNIKGIGDSIFEKIKNNITT